MLSIINNVPAVGAWYHEVLWSKVRVRDPIVLLFVPGYSRQEGSPREKRGREKTGSEDGITYYLFGKETGRL